MSLRRNVLVIGGGAVGTVAALNLQAGGQAHVTMVLRSNFPKVFRDGYQIDSCDHGGLTDWKPEKTTRAVPHSPFGGQPWDYIVLATKNIPDVQQQQQASSSSSLPELVAPAVTPGGATAIVLLQNGLNIERPFAAAFPDTPLISAVSMVGAAEVEPGHVVQLGPDKLLVSPFDSLYHHHHNYHQQQDGNNNDNESGGATAAATVAAAHEFVRIYAAAGRTEASFEPHGQFQRWRKLLYNAALNPISAVLGLDTGRLRLAPGVVEGLVRPAMEEIRAAAGAWGFVLDPALTQFMIDVDPVEWFLEPSMLQDVKKGKLIEYENILGEPLREGTMLGVEMPTVKVLYHMCQAMQWRTMESMGMVTVSSTGHSS